jgi:hypothetical protein
MTVQLGIWTIIHSDEASSHYKRVPLDGFSVQRPELSVVE